MMLCFRHDQTAPLRRTCRHALAESAAQFGELPCRPGGDIADQSAGRITLQGQQKLLHPRPGAGGRELAVPSRMLDHFDWKDDAGANACARGRQLWRQPQAALTDAACAGSGHDAAIGDLAERYRRREASGVEASDQRNGRLTAEDSAVLHVGLVSSDYLSVDDPGARHFHKSADVISNRADRQLVSNIGDT